MVEQSGSNLSPGVSVARATIRRRGILAAAGAAVAGIVAKQTAQPVQAFSDTNFVAMGGSGTAFNVSTGGYSTGVSVTGTNYGVYSSTANGYGVFAVTSGSGAGVHAGVYGGAGGSTNFGVHGVGVTGVKGESDATGGIGVRGEIPAYVGVAPPTPNTAPNTIAVYGVNSSTGANATGVYGAVIGGTGVLGASTTGLGVYGVTSGTGQVAGVYGFSPTAYGIIGTSTASGYSGLTAITSTPNVAALGATSTNANAFAAFFTGTTVVNGNFVATGGTKSAAVMDARGQHRLVYCVESPESWFEDFGKAKLVNGKAEITLDTIFTEIVHTAEYHIHLTPQGDTNGLHVARQSAAGFTVAENKGGTSTVGFAWRVVAKRKDIVGERLAKFEMPKIAYPDPDKLPKPESPKPDPSKKP